VFLLGSVLERQREFGTLQALGATAGQLTRLLLVEAVVLLAAGVGGGLAIGALLAWQYNSFLPGIFSVPLPTITVPVGDLALMLTLALAGSVAASLIGALRLRRLWPAEAPRDI
jgi:putative ABC transport system permease protein